jgi:hypothetical protein
MQLCNVYTQEILREASYEKADIILDIIDSAEKKLAIDPFIVDSQFRLWKADYVTHKIFDEDRDKVYKIFFKVKLNEKQPSIKR